jgi:signal transduction histidine kinase
VFFFVVSSASTTRPTSHMKARYSVPSQDLFFANQELRVVLESHGQQVLERVGRLPVSRLKGESAEQIAEAFAPETLVEPLELHEAERRVTVHDVPSRGAVAVYQIPFTGDRNLWRCRPRTFTLNPPQGRIEDRTLVFEYDATGRDAATIKQMAEVTLRDIRQYLEWINQEVDQFNATIQHEIRQAVATRKSKLLHDEELQSQLQ